MRGWVGARSPIVSYCYRMEAQRGYDHFEGEVTREGMK